MNHERHTPNTTSVYFHAALKGWPGTAQGLSLCHCAWQTDPKLQLINLPFNLLLWTLFPLSLLLAEKPQNPKMFHHTFLLFRDILSLWINTSQYILDIHRIYIFTVGFKNLRSGKKKMKTRNEQKVLGFRKPFKQCYDVKLRNTSDFALFLGH